MLQRRRLWLSSGFLLSFFFSPVSQMITHCLRLLPSIYPSIQPFIHPRLHRCYYLPLGAMPSYPLRVGSNRHSLPVACWLVDGLQSTKETSPQGRPIVRLFFYSAVMVSLRVTLQCLLLATY